MYIANLILYRNVCPITKNFALKNKYFHHLQQKKNNDFFNLYVPYFWQSEKMQFLTREVSKSETLFCFSKISNVT